MAQLSEYMSDNPSPFRLLEMKTALRGGFSVGLKGCFSQKELRHMHGLKRLPLLLCLV